MAESSKNNIAKTVKRLREKRAYLKRVSSSCRCFNNTLINIEAG